jgi:TRAP-type C4-dicarboxylate transport system permease large subunit
METEDLKNRWSSLEEQLKKQEILNEKLIREIRQTRSGPLGMLIRYGYFGIIVSVLVIPLLIYAYIHSVSISYKLIVFYFGGLLALLSIIMGIYNILYLKKIDFTQSVSKNIQLVQTFKINYKKQWIAMCILASLFIIAIIIASTSSSNPAIWRWLSICIAIPATILGGYIEYRKVYKAKTDAILKSLEELKELEE